MFRYNNEFSWKTLARRSRRIYVSVFPDETFSEASVFKSFSEPVDGKLLPSPVRFLALPRAREAQEPGHHDKPEPDPAQLGALEANAGAEQHETDERERDLGPGQCTHRAGPG